MSNLGKLAKGSLLTSNGTDNTYLTIGSNTEVLTADSTAPTGVKWASPSSGGITTINGDSGSITGSSVTIYANNAINNAGASVSFTNTGTTSTLNLTDAANNTFLGKGCGNTTLSGQSNSGYGYGCLGALTSGSYNFSAGVNAMANTQDGQNNIAIGFGALDLNVSGSDSVAIGFGALINSLGSQNSAIGSGSLTNLTSGTANSSYGYLSGSAYTGAEGNNICIGANVLGTAGESNVTRIGNTSTTQVFIRGISGNIVIGAAVICNTNGQLGTISSSIKFKENIQDMMDEDSNSIYHLRPVTFNYKSDKEKHRQIGLIAEEVEKINKDLVVYDALGECHSVKYHDLPILLVQEIQKLLKRIEMLEKTQKP